MSGKTGLGRGLDALIPEEFDSSILENNERVQNLPINKVIPNPEQPRKHFEEEALNELAKSIKNHGIVQPLIVTKYNDDYRIIAGERRWRSAKIAGLKEVPAVVRSLKLLEKMTQKVSLGTTQMGWKRNPSLLEFWLFVLMGMLEVNLLLIPTCYSLATIPILTNMTRRVLIKLWKNSCLTYVKNFL